MAFALVSACSEPANQKLEPMAENYGKIEVSRIAVLEDPLAYDNRRGIYIIRDTRSGKEFIGISGIGISELGSHTEMDGDGNATRVVSDER